jgi:hypothetical protein
MSANVPGFPTRSCTGQVHEMGPAGLLSDERVTIVRPARREAPTAGTRCYPK